MKQTFLSQGDTLTLATKLEFIDDLYLYLGSVSNKFGFQGDVNKVSWERPQGYLVYLNKSGGQSNAA